MDDVVMLHSGGLDSFVTSAILLGLGKKVDAIFFDYGQVTAGPEFAAAFTCVNELQDAYGDGSITLRREIIVDYRKWVEDNALVSGTAPAHTEDGKLIFIPGRNIVFLLYAAIASYKKGIREVAFSSHASDRISGDCRPEFVAALQETFKWGFGTCGAQEPYRIWSPLQNMTKAQVVKEGSTRGLHLERSWSCYRVGDIHCGVCHNCSDRHTAFVQADVPDPTRYLHEPE